MEKDRFNSIHPPLEHLLTWFLCELDGTDDKDCAMKRDKGRLVVHKLFENH